MTTAHNWTKYPWLKWEICSQCGVVKRTDGKNSPCRGHIRAVLRELPPLKPLPEEYQNREE